MFLQTMAQKEKRKAFRNGLRNIGNLPSLNRHIRRNDVKRGRNELPSQSKLGDAKLHCPGSVALGSKLHADMSCTPKSQMDRTHHRHPHRANNRRHNRNRMAEIRRNHPRRLHSRRNCTQIAANNQHKM